MSEVDKLLGLSVREFIAATAAKRATPGGGAVAGVVGALGAALGEMSLSYTRGKEQYAEHADTHERIAARLERAREMLERLVGEDASAYGLYRDAMKMAEGPAKDRASQAALAAAIDVPREVSKLCVALLRDLKQLAPISNPHLVSDLVAAGVLAVAACRVSDGNVRINVPQVADADAAAQVRQSSADDLATADKLLAELEAAAAS